MNIYQIPWLFHLIYEHDCQKMTIRLSALMQEKLNINQETLNFDCKGIISFIHKYDYRKLAYFTTHQEFNTFDTVMRFKFPNQKGYIKTQAICDVTSKGLSCVHVDEFELIKTRKKIEKNQESKTVKIVWSEDQLLKMSQIKGLNKYKQQITEILHR